MNRFAKYIAFTGCLALLLSFTGKHPPEPHVVTLRFHSVIGNHSLELGRSYVNALGDTIAVQRFKYYVSNIIITDAVGKDVYLFPRRYYLVDAEDSASQSIQLKIPALPLKQVRFTLGVDSIRNVSGVQTGALDPLHGMFWTWNSGYIMAKLEGVSSSAHVPGQRFTYHVGGFKAADNTARVITLDLPPGTAPVDEINIAADINAWFKGGFLLKIGEHPICHSPGGLAVQIADNYKGMFSISSVR